MAMVSARLRFDAGAGRSKNVQVPFRIFTKRKLFVLKEAGKKDEYHWKERYFCQRNIHERKGVLNTRLPLKT